MAIKNALIVDDSKTARVVLKRMLNELKLEVDTVESAKDALEYLKSHAPDVIFMDHMMPEMDGFEAVKRIKSNPETAIIPIMMYTSRGGDMYLSQAKALGAVGVIPKTISPVGLKEALFELGLVKDRRVATSLKLEPGMIDRRKPENKSITEDLAAIKAETKHLQAEVKVTAQDGAAVIHSKSKNTDEGKQADVDPVEVKPVVNKQIEDRPAEDRQSDDRQIKESLLKKQSEHDTYIEDLKKLMDEQTIELHKSMWLGIETVSHEIFNRLNSELEQQLDKIQSAGKDASENSITGSKISWPVLITLTVLIASITLNITLLSNTHKHNTAESTTVAETDPITETEVAESVVIDGEHAEDNTEAVASSFKKVDRTVDRYAAVKKGNKNQLDEVEFIEWAHNREIEYPFDELALNENRLPGIEALVNKAVDAEYSGTIILQMHVGQFCLGRDENSDYQLADEKLPVTKCEFIGNFKQPNDVSSAHQSVDFANYLSGLSSLSEKGIKVDVSSSPRSTNLSDYPEKTLKTTAAEWNSAAQSNNRITVKLEPLAVD